MFIYYRSANQHRYGSDTFCNVVSQYARLLREFEARKLITLIKKTFQGRRRTLKKSLLLCSMIQSLSGGSQYFFHSSRLLMNTQMKSVSLYYRIGIQYTLGHVRHVESGWLPFIT